MRQNVKRARLSVVPRASDNAAPRSKASPAQVVPPGTTDAGPEFLRDSYAATAFAEVLDRSLHAAVARFTAGVSPMTLIGAYADWAAHLSHSPGKQLQLAEKAMRKWLRLVTYANRSVFSRDGCEPCIEPLPQDRRFLAEAWRKRPYDVDLPVLPAHAAVVAQRDDGRPWRQRAEREDRRVRHAPVARRLFAVEPSAPQSRSRRAHAGGNGHEPRPRRAELPRGLGAHGGRPRAGGNRGVSGRARDRGHAGQGRLPQSPDRADPVRAGHRHRAARAGAHRSGVDHEVLHPRLEPRTTRS